MNKFFLSLVMLPSGLWRSMGADTEQLQAILDVRLRMDDRKPVNFGRQRRQQTKERNNSMWLTMFLSALMGLIYMFPLTLGDRIFSLTFYFTLIILFLTLTLITDFSNVLFDARDIFIIFPRPVDDRTLLLSRLLHVFIYLLRIVLPMSLPGWILLGYFDGWKSALLFPFAILLLVCIILFLVNGCYLLILKIFGAQRFKEIINYFQIVASILFFATAYLLPNMFNHNNKMQHLTAADLPWIRFLPTYWLASLWSWIGVPVALSGTAFLAGLAIVFPLVCLWILLRWFAPNFTAQVSGINLGDGAGHRTGKAAKAGKSSFYKQLANTFNRDESAKAGFIITWLQTSRSRSFKMRVYPTFAYIPVYFVYLATRNGRSLHDGWNFMVHGPSYLILLYLSSFVLMQAMNYLTISEQYKAAWIYYAAPVETPGKVMSGAFKAMWFKYFLPFFLVLSAFVVGVLGFPALFDIVLALVNVTLFAACMMRVAYRHFPFSTMEQMNQRGTRVLKAFVSMIIPASLGFAHYFSLHIFWLKFIFLILSSLLLWLVWDSYAKTSWQNLMMAELE